MSAARLAALSRQVAALVQAQARESLPASAVALAEAAGYTLDPWQRDVLEGSAPRIALNVCRQGGKSTVAALAAVWAALSVPGALILTVSASERQAKELLRVMTSTYRAVGEPLGTDAETVLRLELANGSRIIALPSREQTIRGFASVALLVLDEAARIDDQVYFAVRPMLAVSGGRLLTLSTPNGRRGWWWTAWSEGEGWQRVEIPAEACPRISPAFLAEERRALPAGTYRQEYECSFEATQDAAFDAGDILAAFDDDVEPLFPLSA